MRTIILLASSDNEFNQELINYAKLNRQDVEWVLPTDERAALAEVAACWFPDASTLTQFPNIKVLLALSAGVDQLGSSLLRSGLPVCRIVDEGQKQGMFEYVLWGVLNAHRHFDRAQKNQKTCHWKHYPQKTAADIHVSVLGLGVLGKHVAQSLAQIGYSVSGWSRSPKNIENVTCTSGEEAFSKMLSTTDILVNLLPLNSATSNILNKTVFDTLPPNAYLINCGRGGHINEIDLIDSIHQSHLRGALLDVFDEEPLDSSNPLWHTDGILITPHMASEASISTIVKQTSDNAKRFEKNALLKNMIDEDKGY
tara:strand:+ start:1122 stop:2054 length:933 start_codon:yes stop_codon:yes gene_type:complete